MGLDRRADRPGLVGLGLQRRGGFALVAALFPALDQLDERLLQIARGFGVARLQRAQPVGERAVFAVLTAADLREAGLDGARGGAVAAVDVVQPLGQRLDLAGMGGRDLVDRTLEVARGGGLTLLEAGEALGDRGERGVDRDGGLAGAGVGLGGLGLQRGDRLFEGFKEAVGAFLLGGGGGLAVLQRRHALDDLRQRLPQIARAFMGAGLGPGGLGAQIAERGLQRGQDFARPGAVLTDDAIAFVEAVEALRQRGERGGERVRRFQRARLSGGELALQVVEGRFEGAVLVLLQRAQTRGDRPDRLFQIGAGGGGARRGGFDLALQAADRLFHAGQRGGGFDCGLGLGRGRFEALDHAVDRTLQRFEGRGLFAVRGLVGFGGGAHRGVGRRFQAVGRFQPVGDRRHRAVELFDGGILAALGLLDAPVQIEESAAGIDHAVAGVAGLAVTRLARRAVARLARPVAGHPREGGPRIVVATLIRSRTHVGGSLFGPAAPRRGVSGRSFGDDPLKPRFERHARTLGGAARRVPQFRRYARHVPWNARSHRQPSGRSPRQTVVKNAPAAGQPAARRIARPGQSPSRPCHVGTIGVNARLKVNAPD